jgi:hypothetical protein
MTPTPIPAWLFGTNPVNRSEWAVHLAEPRFMLHAVGAHDWIIPLGNKTVGDLLVIKQAVAWYREHMTKMAPDGPITIVEAPLSIEAGPTYLCMAVGIEKETDDSFFVVRVRAPMAVFPIEANGTRLGDPIWLDKPDTLRADHARIITDEALEAHRRYVSAP